LCVNESKLRYQLYQDNNFQGRVLILALTLCHAAMNDQSKYHDKVLAKAIDILNYPESHKERIAMSAASLVSFDEQGEPLLTDEDLTKILIDAADAMAGVMTS
jgi:hypothetical protein